MIARGYQSNILNLWSFVIRRGRTIRNWHLHVFWKKRSVIQGVVSYVCVCYFIGLEAWNIFLAALQINRRCFPTDCHSEQVPLIANEGLFWEWIFFFLFACKLNFICSNLDVVVDVFLSQVERLAAVSGWFATSFGADRNSLNPIDMNFAHLCLPTYSRWGSTKFPSITARAQYVSSKFRGIYSIFKKNVFWLYLF